MILVYIDIPISIISSEYYVIQNLYLNQLVQKSLVSYYKIRTTSNRNSRFKKLKL